MRLANSPDVYWRKNFVGNVKSLFQRAASVAMSIRVVIRITAIVRTTPSAAIVKLVTIIIYVTVTKPCRSNTGIMSWKIVSVTIGIISGIRLENNPTATTVL